MNALTTTDAISPATLEHVLGTGDISKLSTQQRVEFYKAACRSLNLNPLTRPIRFLTFQGQTQAYFTRDGTDQLRKNNKLSLNVVDKHTEDGVYVVTVRAKSPDGREDEDIGAVPIAALKGDALANAYMKCLTKAKRRVTLSFCGLGWSSEDELDTMHGARTFDHDAEIEPPKPAAAPEPELPPLQKMTWAQHAEALEIAERDTPDSGVGLLLAKAEVTELYRLAKEGKPSPAKQRILDVMHRLEERYLADPPEPSEEEEAPAIKGEEYAAAGD